MYHPSVTFTHPFTKTLSFHLMVYIKSTPPSSPLNEITPPLIHLKRNHRTPSFNLTTPILLKRNHPLSPVLLMLNCTLSLPSLLNQNLSLPPILFKQTHPALPSFNKTNTHSHIFLLILNHPLLLSLLIHKL